MIHQLPAQFDGIGEVKGYSISLVERSETACVYAVTDRITSPHYEVFKRKFSPVCLDFKTRLYSETDKKESYPKSRSFGTSAWVYGTLERAMKKYVEINAKENKK